MLIGELKMILVDICIPTIDSNYDFMLDENVPISQVLVEISEMVAKKMGEKRPADIKNLMLCSVDNGEILEKNKTLYNCGIVDGSSLILV